MPRHPHCHLFRHHGADGPAAAARTNDYLQKCVASGVTDVVEYRAAKAEVARLRK
jgi:hypothetical protein